MRKLRSSSFGTEQELQVICQFHAFPSLLSRVSLQQGRYEPSLLQIETLSEVLKLAQRHPAVGEGALENPGQLRPGQVCTYCLLPSPSQWKRGSENWKSICGKVWYSYFIIFSIIFYSNILSSIVIPFVQERKQSQLPVMTWQLDCDLDVKFIVIILNQILFPRLTPVLSWIAYGSSLNSF